MMHSFLVLSLCITLVAHVRVSVPNEPAHVKAEGKEAGPQEVTQSSQVWDGEVIRVHSSTPHPINHPVCQVQENHDLWQQEQEQRVTAGI